jgi:Rap guanine nucleotide exchange factor 4
MGLSNTAVARLTQTWERVPNKLKRTFSQFEAQIDPSRNHRRYRLFLSTLEPPIIPFMPLFLKDMTFAHEGNKTYLETGLINFEKMQMIAQTLRTIRHCKSRSMKLDPSVCKFKSSIRSIDLFFRDLKVIDNQRTLTQMSHQLEHRKTGQGRRRQFT